MPSSRDSFRRNRVAPVGNPIIAFRSLCLLGAELWFATCKSMGQRTRIEARYRVRKAISGVYAGYLALNSSRLPGS